MECWYLRGKQVNGLICDAPIPPPACFLIVIRMEWKRDPEPFINTGGQRKKRNQKDNKTSHTSLGVEKNSKLSCLRSFVFHLCLAEKTSKIRKINALDTKKKLEKRKKEKKKTENWDKICLTFNIFVFFLVLRSWRGFQMKQNLLLSQKSMI